jgi:hypothetical protein
MGLSPAILPTFPPLFYLFRGIETASDSNDKESEKRCERRLRALLA